MASPTGPRPERNPARGPAEIAARVGGVIEFPGPDGAAAPDVAALPPVRGVSLDSRAVRPGDLYAALPGARTHGAGHVLAALRAGAVAVLTDPAGRDLVAERLRDRDPAEPVERPVPVIVVASPREQLGPLSAWLYGDPAGRLLTLGVTGTNGKTTTTFLIESALRGLGVTTGLIGTVETRIGDQRVTGSGPAPGTTPEAPDLQALLAVMAERGVGACALELSSHAVDQRRLDGLVVDVVGFSNLSRDHLDYHGTMAAYFEVKARLFTPAHARRAVVVVDDEWGRTLAGSCGLPLTTVAALPAAPGAAPADWQVRAVHPRDGGSDVELTCPDGTPLRLRCPLPGGFNVANAVLALAMLVAAGYEPAAAAAALGAAGAVPGRMEPVPGGPGDPLVVVDYAHTPDAVALALSALRSAGTPLVIVLGAGGDRDRAKRPLMGAAAAGGADVVIVTDDNPRSEDPAEIRAAVLAGAREAAAGTATAVREVADRRLAIAEGLAAAAGGVLLIAGKGHEQGQDIGGTVHPFDDRVEARAALAGPARHGSSAGRLPAAQGRPGAGRSRAAEENLL